MQSRPPPPMIWWRWWLNLYLVMRLFCDLAWVLILYKNCLPKNGLPKTGLPKDHIYPEEACPRKGLPRNYGSSKNGMPKNEFPQERFLQEGYAQEPKHGLSQNGLPCLPNPKRSNIAAILRHPWWMQTMVCGMLCTSDLAMQSWNAQLEPDRRKSIGDVLHRHTCAASGARATCGALDHTSYSFHGILGVPTLSLQPDAQYLFLFSIEPPAIAIPRDHRKRVAIWELELGPFSFLKGLWRFCQFNVLFGSCGSSNLGAKTSGPVPIFGVNICERSNFGERARWKLNSAI